MRSLTWLAVSDELIISGGGVNLVGTATLFLNAERLDRGIAQFGYCRVELNLIRQRLDRVRLQSCVPYEAFLALAAIEDALVALQRLEDHSNDLAVALKTSARRYSETERAAANLSQGIAAALGYGLGSLLSLIAPVVLPRAVVVSGVFLAAAALAKKQFAAAREQLADWLDSNRALLTSPGTVDAIRTLVMTGDDFVAGVLRMNPSAAALLGDEGAAAIGLEAVTKLVSVGGSAAGLFTDTPVEVIQLSQTTGELALSAADRAGSIPGSDPGDPQIRIDRIMRAGAPDRFEVYLGGTVDFSPRTAGEPFDLTSDLASISGGDSAAYRATRKAMAQAGVQATSEVIFNGYSLGGLVAARLAASGEYNTRGLYTLGAPAGRVPVPKRVPWLAVQHSDDLVPALGGRWQSREAVMVERQVFAGGNVDRDFAIPAHQLSRYRDTAQLVDEIEEDRVVSVLGSLAEFGRGADRVVSTYYRAERLSD